jgi:hypothetical protein
LADSEDTLRGEKGEEEEEEEEEGQIATKE